MATGTNRRAPAGDRLARALAGHGLLLRGGLHPVADDAVPDPVPGRPAATLLLVGNAGPAMWRHFAASPEAADPALADPLNAWSARILAAIAAPLGARALLPFEGPPYLPFLRWAQRAEPVHPSPLGLLIHPDYGLWHAYRGALAFAERLALPPPDRRRSPCDGCAARPCLTACPVGAFSGQGYDLDACVAHVRGAGGADCRQGACLARRACPVGRDYRYAPAQAGFHMAAFLRARA